MNDPYMTGQHLSGRAREAENITVHADRIRSVMAGGIGASWHAMSNEHVDDGPEYTWALRAKNSRGSAWGGNPPVTDEAAWEQLFKHASWLGLSFLRVEMEARMYEPERNTFDWDNQEMAALYKILDWAEASSADVFLQQMWSNVKWNAYPGVQPLLSAPRSLDDFAEGLAAVVEYLIRTKGYTCIKWLGITNEPPGGSWGSWWSMGEAHAPLTPAFEAVRRALDARGLAVPISGPGWTDLPAFDAARIDFDQFIGAYDLHCYQTLDESKEETLRQWVDWAHAHGKPFFLTEIGNMSLGWGDDSPIPKSFAASLSNAEAILRGFRAGVGGFNRWSFTNRGDLDGQWQLVRTWDIQGEKYYDRIEPEPAAYYGYGVISRFCAKHSSVLEVEQERQAEVLSAAVNSPGGIVTIYLLNKGEEPRTVRISVSGAGTQRLFLYRVTEEEVTVPGFALNPMEETVLIEGGSALLHLPGKSVTTLSSHRRK